MRKVQYLRICMSGLTMNQKDKEKINKSKKLNYMHKKLKMKKLWKILGTI